MTFTDHFSVLDDAIGPQPWMQLRQVASALRESVSKNYDPNDGLAKNDALQSVRVQWTNTSPVTQYVYGMVSKSGSQVTLQARSRGYLSTQHGVSIGAAGSAVTLSEVSRFGVGSDLGNGGILGFGGEFGVSELRQNSTTIPLLPQITGWFSVAPTETFNAEVTVTFISENWENTPISGGDADTESKVITGDLRVDLFALPAVVAPGPRLTPTLVGGTSNVRSAITTTTTTTVTTPTGLQTNDVLLAVVANGYGLPNATTPVESGWALLHSQAAAELFGLLNGVNLRVFIRKITGSAAGSYSFTNSLGSEQIATLIGLRSAVSYDSTEGLNWYVSSSLTRYDFFTQFKSQFAPSISKSGQLLLCASYFSHLNTQAPVTQTAPEGMTKIGDFSGGLGTMTLAFLNTPPNPTRDRTFTPNKVPQFQGYSVAASILVPGTR